MKRLIAVVIVLATLATTGTAQATMFNVAEMKGSVSFTPELLAVEFGIGNDYMHWGFGLPIMNVLKQTLYQAGDSPFHDTFASALTRTYTPFKNTDGTLDNTNGWNYMYDDKEVTFFLWWCGLDEVLESRFFCPIVDLSGYTINDFYLYTDVLQDLGTLSYHMDLLADATAVPEPSTLLLLVACIAGVTAISVLRKEAVL